MTASDAPDAAPDSAAPAVSIIAPAKLTLSLRVTGVRDDGYHLIDAEMVSLDWADRLDITPGRSGITADGPFAEGVPLDDRNLVAAALRLAGRSAAVHLHKQLPHGGGLGGGSSDAAAVLRWAGLRDPARAVALGADVAYCVVGGRARVRGIGEIVEPLPFAAVDVTLVVPPIHVSTPAVYAAWDQLGGPTADGPNDLEPAALAVAPELAPWRDRLGDATGVTPVLAGSGGTWFVHGHHDIDHAFDDLVPGGRRALVRQTSTIRHDEA
ncbi:MAG: 4-(cytidine 5'-diphospho)-2-C-methyl-D-erythritol kinase [Ilumatobacteraceae bacterium]